MPIELITQEEERRDMHVTMMINRNHQSLREAYSDLESIWADMRDRHFKYARKMEAENAEQEKVIFWLASRVAKLMAEASVFADINVETSHTPEYWIEHAYEAVKDGEQ